MRICDLCKNEVGSYNAEFRDAVGDVKFLVDVWAQRDGITIDLCKDCAAKGALAVLGVNPTETKPEKS